MVFYAYANLAGEKTHEEWVLDSGVDSHFIINRSAFTTYMPLIGQSVKGIAGSVDIKGRGEVIAEFTAPSGKKSIVSLQDCAHVPSFPSNLLSISQFDSDGVKTHFHDGKVRMTKPWTNHVFTISSKPIGNNKGLYRVHMSTKAEKALISAGEPEEQTWEE